ncbi:DNA (cytosine-5)-methyltransferase [Trema orientale]|uniref:DNA (Cytosine-5)-methyltransferase n=1 Tax=Trema orientale TaxID=63057 RepID=A0A2P5F8L9_TREOI|nr:DNA (cytosine-5)-methyltransferase [Trema orientale]
MASSDDEAEALPLSVANYHFVDDKDEPVSFSVLPIQWRESEPIDGKKLQVFLHGTADNGLQKIYKRVIAWKFDLSNVKPEISVLSKENNWIKLQKPRKSFEDVIRSILITVHCLHFVMRNPETSGKSLWDHLSKVFSLYEVRPSENDLVDHTTLISEAVERNEALSKSEFLLAFLNEKPIKRRLPNEERQATAISRFIVDDTDADTVDYAEEDESNEDDELFDTVCTFCDNGGDLLCCEGSCLRSFHATVEAGEDSLCNSLGYTEDEVNAIQQFLCKNCEYKQHQCFVCGNLGSSDKYSGAEVFRCVSATCGRFYHPRCVAKLLILDNGVSAEDLEKKIAEGESFTCPIHKCCVCKQGENKKDPDLQFAVCRRCPKSYHCKCLPRKISFENIEKEDIIARAWSDLLPNRILIYCLKHEIDEEIGTPVRNHVKFPGAEEKKSTSGKMKTSIGEKRQKQTSGLLGDGKKNVSKTKITVLPSEESLQGRTTYAASKLTKKSSFALKVGSKETSGKLSSGSNTPKRKKVNDASRKELNSPMAEDSLGNRLFELMNERSGTVKSGKQSTSDGKLNKATTVNPATEKLSSELPPLDADRERRLLDLMKDAESSITIEDIRKKYKVPSTHVTTQKFATERAAITLGKVEVAVEAVRAALRKLEEGSSIEDAKAVCQPEVVQQLFRWKDRLGVSLAPFLHGMRYTSFGRHFTKVEKLEEIANKLHWYVQGGDMIVDFCCGANDFSVVMKKKLDETGKKCSYKNYDFIQPKNDFNFEKRDWMTVQPKELPTGSKLIMGLNPPFGVKASLANQFINKALKFKPKLLILIVPPETQRLDKKESPYDLVWEDDRFLSGKSFYLPGSVNVRDEQMEQWNATPPLLYLWSHPDWSAKHREIAESHGHISKQQEAVEGHSESLIPDQAIGDHDDYGDIPERATSNHGNYGDIPDHAMDDPGDYGDLPDHAMDDPGSYGDILDHAMDDHGNPMVTDDPLETENFKDYLAGVVETGRKEGSPLISSDRGNHVQGKKPSNGKSKKRSRGTKRNKRRASGGLLTESKRDDGSRPLVREMHNGMPPYTGIGVNSYQNLESSTPGSHSQFGTAYGDDILRRYSVDGDEHHSRFSSRSVTDYGVRNLEEHQSIGHTRDSTDGFGGRTLEMEDMLRRESGIRSQVRLYGQQGPEVQGSYYLGGQDPRYGQIGSHTPFSSTYGHPGPISEPYRLNSSGMQWYVPQLDALHHTRMSALGAEPPPMFGGNNVFDPRAPHHGHPGGPMSFASGPHQPYSHHNSAGWLND